MQDSIFTTAVDGREHLSLAAMIALESQLNPAERAARDEIRASEGWLYAR